MERQASATRAVVAPVSFAPTTVAMGARRAPLPDGRWHFQHGPIDLVIGADGDARALTDAIERCWVRFETVLVELVGELRLLRAPVTEATGLRGGVARRMLAACWPHRAQFITPMAAVAGAVADEMIDLLGEDERILRAYVNNGGDIALHLTHGQQFRIGLVADIGRVKRREQVDLDGDFAVTADSRVRGVATSGWRGRSFSLGIADSVTVLARTAAEADAAATMVANSVNVDDPAILRKRACELKDDTDLGDRLVTVGVGPLSDRQVERALNAGAAHAQRLLEAETLYGAVLCLQGQGRVVGAALPPGQMLPVRAPATCAPLR